MPVPGGALWLPDYLHDEGLPVRVVPGWQDRGKLGGRYAGIVFHHIGIGGNADSPGLGVVTHGRPGLRNALCHVHHSRSGVPTVVAAGVAWHAGTGSWAGLTGNQRVLGVEQEGTTGQPLTAQQRANAPRIAAALLRGLRREERVVCQHYEWAPGRKVDTWGIRDPNAFRRAAAALLDPPALPTPRRRRMFMFRYKDSWWIFVGDGHPPRRVATVPDLEILGVALPKAADVNVSDAQWTQLGGR